LYYSHVIQTLDVFVVKLVKFFSFLLLLDSSLVNKDFHISSRPIRLAVATAATASVVVVVVVVVVVSFWLLLCI